MKKKFLALLCALTLAFGLAGCTLSTPDSVGYIGDIEITSGLYLLAQYDAYQQAADLAADGQDASKVKSFLKQTITTDEESGETAVVSEYVAQKTLENLQTYAAIEARFDELGGELTVQQETQADSYAEQIMEQYGDTYEANGIGLETIKRLERILMKGEALLDLVYGENGETPVSDAELTDYLQNRAVYADYTIVPLYNTSTYAFADDDQKATMLSLAQAAAETYNSAIPATAAEQTAQFEAAALTALPSIYAVLDGTYSGSESDFTSDLLTETTLQDNFTENDSAAALLALDYGEAAAVQYSSYAMILAVRTDPLETVGLDALRSSILSELKSDELAAALKEYGAQMENTLDTAAMEKLPARKIVNS